MTATVAQILTQLVQQAADAAGHADAPIPMEPCVPTNDTRFGHYQSNFAFRLGKSLRTNPRQVATAIHAELPEHPLVDRWEVAGPGFLNAHLVPDALAEQLGGQARDARFGGPTPGEGKTVVIDYSSPNIAKRMHVGHLRSTIIGNALDRVLRYLGFTVVADNHIGDWGTQFGLLIDQWRTDRDEAAYAEDAIAELQRLYKLGRARAKDDPSVMDRARVETAKLQAGDPENTALWEQFKAASLEEFQAVYDRLGVRFDEVLGESFYQPMLDGILQRLLDAGLAEESDGALVVRFGEDDPKDLGEVMLVRKSDGAALYGTTDLATVAHRMETWSPDRIVYVTDDRQALHFRQFFHVSRQLGYTDVAFEHVQFGLLRFADGSVAATRSTEGGTANLVDVLDEAKRRARIEVDARAGESLDEGARDHMAEAIGAGAVRYADLSQNPASDIVFDWDKMVAFTGNTAAYLMYVHARCCSILRNAGIDDDAALAATPSLAADEELALGLALVRLPEVVEVVGRTMRPNLLADHLFQLGQAYSQFYLACPVLKGDVDAETRDARLALVAATKRGMALGLDLLGLEALERM